MVHLMLEDHRVVVARHETNRRTFAVEGLHRDLAVPFDVDVEVWDGQAALIPDDRPLGRNNPGIDEGEEEGLEPRLLIARLGLADSVAQRHGGDQDALTDPHLRRGETHARRGIHGLGHVGDQRPDPIVDRRDRLGRLLQDRVGDFVDREEGHGGREIVARSGGVKKALAPRSLPAPSDPCYNPARMRPLRYIAVEGVIGVGKSSLTRLLADRLHGRCVLEPVIENPFLPRFYQDRRRFAFQTQLYFLLTRYQQQMELMQPGLFQQATVCDYLFAKDRMFATLNLDREELALYNQIYEQLDARLPAPDLVVYLQADVDVLLERIERRGLEFEKRIDATYLRDLSELYNDFFFNYRETPLLFVQCSGIDFVGNTQDREWLVQEVLSMEGGTKHLVPLGS